MQQPVAMPSSLLIRVPPAILQQPGSLLDVLQQVLPGMELHVPRPLGIVMYIVSYEVLYRVPDLERAVAQFGTGLEGKVGLTRRDGHFRVWGRSAPCQNGVHYAARASRPYPPAFRARGHGGRGLRPAQPDHVAVDLVSASGLRPAQVARDLGLTPETLRLWLTQTAIDAGARAGLTSDERAALARRRREHAILAPACSSLTRATACCAQAGLLR